MSHLKKLSDRIGKLPISSAKPIEILGISKSQVLEFPANRPLSISKQIREYQIPSLLLSASKYGLCSLSANQIGFNLAAFVIHKNLEDNKWTNYESTPKDYEVYINPLVTHIQGELCSGFEECPSVQNVFIQSLKQYLMFFKDKHPVAYQKILCQ